MRGEIKIESRGLMGWAKGPDLKIGLRVAAASEVCNAVQSGYSR